MAQSYRYLDDVAVADLAFEAAGDSLEELFQAATRALFEAMADPATVGASWAQAIEREDGDPAALLFDWLSDVVYWKDAAGVVFSQAQLRVSPASEGGWCLKAELRGEAVNPSTQELRADVKGVTKHLYDVRQAHGRWTARVVLDV